MMLHIGDDLPLFTLLDADGQSFSPIDLRGSNGLVIVFGHGTWCSHCVQQFRRLNQAADALAGLQVGLAAIIRDPVAQIAAYRQTAVPPPRYPMLADSDPSLSKDFGNFDEEHQVPHPALFYVAPDNRIGYSEIPADAHRPLNIERVVNAIRAGLEEAGS